MSTRALEMLREGLPERQKKLMGPLIAGVSLAEGMISILFRHIRLNQ